MEDKKQKEINDTTNNNKDNDKKQKNMARTNSFFDLRQSLVLAIELSDRNANLLV